MEKITIKPPWPPKVGWKKLSRTAWSFCHWAVAPAPEGLQTCHGWWRNRPCHGILSQKLAVTYICTQTHIYISINILYIIYILNLYIYTYTEYTYVYRPVPPIPIKESCGFIRAHRPPSCQSTFTAPLEVSGGDEVVTPRHQRTSKTMVNILGTGTVSGCQSFQTWAVPGSNSHPKQSALALS